MRKGALTATAVYSLMGLCLVVGEAACTSDGSPTAKASSSTSTTGAATRCFDAVASQDAGAYVGLSLSDAEARATARHDYLTVVEEDGTCTVSAAPAYIGPSLIVEVALVGGKVAVARSGYASSR